MTKDEAWSWFQAEVPALGLDHTGVQQAWESAWRAHEHPDVSEAKWMGWIRKLRQKALSKTKGTQYGPSGLFLRLLRDERPPIETEPEGINPRYVEWSVLRDELPEERPSLAEATRCLHHGGETALDEYLQPFREEEMRCKSTVTTI